MDGGDGGSFDAPAPPLGGLGNFKGVMLCNRPAEDGAGRGSGDGPGPFKSMIAAGCGEQIGLTPCRNFEPTVKKRGPAAALRRHVKWLRELQDQMAQEKQEVELEDAKAKARLERMKAKFDVHRGAAKQILKERSEGTGEPGKAAAAAKGSKPMWAMTEQEKEAFDEGEADDLISFAEGLDYEKFIHDDDFRQCLAAVNDRAGRLKKEQEAFKDALVHDFNLRAEEEDRSTCTGGSPRGGALPEEGIEGQSVLGDLRSECSAASARRNRGEERYGAGDEKDWDGSTRCGEDRPEVDAEVRSVAESILEANPKLRGIYSKESLQKVVEKVRDRPPEADALALKAMMYAEGPAPVPVITTSADTQGKLHKPVDPSQLPYLYRSPAV